ncbi:MAG TPA: DUF488 family protein [Methanobacteriaceae archaeon]|nr:DUF488 family protein [Methanobacteriaceae archaeon]
MIQVKSLVEPFLDEDGFRILVENNWPLELDKKKVKVNLWLKELAPSPELINWPVTGSISKEEFREKYRDQLRRKKTLLNYIKKMEKEQGTITLLYSDISKESVMILENKLNGYKTIRGSVDRIHG